MNKRGTEIEYCPHCNANLRGDSIPDDIVHNYSGTHWSRKIGLYDKSRDRTVAYECPDCGGQWERLVYA
ncbi:hypothetical protein [Paenibacillus pini]|uniref:Uncharacterized protein n=1 Tax=Paenibacillus pini JCM 16418 TaxID=1236976 RepID=W7YU49_9BACL|nr:hypothetical protein [Paenibacillus pini]GAF10728.1 hypothetical protein JCM16418_4947 [Paenibacillus pini JCM 16418]